MSERNSPTLQRAMIASVALVLIGCGGSSRKHHPLAASSSTGAPLQSSSTSSSTSVTLQAGPRVLWTTTPNGFPNVQVGVWNIPLQEQEALAGFRLRGLDLFGISWQLQDASVDGRYLLFTDVYQHSSVLYDRRAERGFTVPIAHAQRISEDGRFILTTANALIELYDREKDATVPLAGIEPQLSGTRIDMSDDAGRIAYVSNTGLWVYDVATQRHVFASGQNVGLSHTDGSGARPFLSADGGTLVYLTRSPHHPVNGVVLVQDLATQATTEPARIQPAAPSSYAFQLEGLSADGRTLLLSGTGDGPFGSTRNVAVYDLAADRFADLSGLTHASQPVGLSVSAGGTHVAGVWTGGDGIPAVYLLDVQAGSAKPLGQAQSYRTPISATLIR